MRTFSQKQLSLNPPVNEKDPSWNVSRIALRVLRERFGGTNVFMDRASEVEACALRRSGRAAYRYAGERLRVLEVDSFPQLGKVVALRFLEWVLDHAGGAVALPTGRTPEHFIAWVSHFLEKWGDADAEADMKAWGLDVAARRRCGLEATPRMDTLRFFQIDEFYPMDPRRPNSFRSYVLEHYVDGFGLDAAKAVTIDTWRLGCADGDDASALFRDGVDVSLRWRAAATPLEAKQQTALRAVDEYCTAYEDRIAAVGGIGFFLGGIGPDGHVAFNCRGSDLRATTRLCETNYETQAAAAGDLGGIEVARKGLVVTIGMGTIASAEAVSRHAVAVVFAAGDAKAAVVADAPLGAVLGSRSNARPASALQALPGSVFVLTRSAASRLPARALEDFSARALLGGGSGPCFDDVAAHQVVVDAALLRGRRLDDVTAADVRATALGAALLDSGRHDRGAAVVDDDIVRGFATAARANLVSALDRGLAPAPAATFLHTAPHHDDIMLGYLAKVAHELDQADDAKSHTFAYATSGFNAVTNAHAAETLRSAADWVQAPGGAGRAAAARGDFLPPKAKGAALGGDALGGDASAAAYDADVDSYLDGHAARDAARRDVGLHRRALRIVAALFSAPPAAGAAPWLDAAWLAATARGTAAHFEAQPPGTKDVAVHQLLKGMLREFEADLLWAYHGCRASAAVKHLRLGFYQGDLFTEEPSMRRDVAPIVDLLREAPPDVVTVALDPEGSGPDTHFKVLQAVAAALRVYAGAGDGAAATARNGNGHGAGGGNGHGAPPVGNGHGASPTAAPVAAARAPPRVWGYRNVWYKFKVTDATLIFPTAPSDHAALVDAFDAAFISQRNASFPAPGHDGPFSHLAQVTQAEQFGQLVTLLGRDFFARHADRRVRAARGAVFIKDLALADFLASARDLQDKTGD
ncbi:hypothetical protein M885DRAFT_446744 [Pelagophyceae sp. CCMP2097]|nr:hypothetical protein M885DRAFT_446744 [Pelagophyceae sp. CCMP2097]